MGAHPSLEDRPVKVAKLAVPPAAPLTLSLTAPNQKPSMESP